MRGHETGTPNGCLPPQPPAMSKVRPLMIARSVAPASWRRMPLASDRLAYQAKRRSTSSDGPATKPSTDIDMPATIVAAPAVLTFEAFAAVLLPSAWVALIFCLLRLPCSVRFRARTAGHHFGWRLFRRHLDLLGLSRAHRPVTAVSPSCRGASGSRPAGAVQEGRPSLVPEAPTLAMAPDDAAAAVRAEPGPPGQRRKPRVNRHCSRLAAREGGEALALRLRGEFQHALPGEHIPADARDHPVSLARSLTHPPR